MIVKGQRGPHYMGQRPSRSGKIVRVVDVWIGTEAEVKGINFSSYNGYNTSRIGDTPVWQAEAWKETSPTGALISDTYDLKYNTKQEPIRYNPILQAQVDRTEVGLIYDVFKAMQRGESGMDYEAAVTEIRGFTVNPDDAVQLFDWIIAGVNNYFDFDYSFIWTRSAASGVSIPINYEGENAVYTSTANMLAGEGVAGVSFDLPSKQWLKLPVDISEQYGGRIEVQYQYWGADEWPNLLYTRV